MVNKPNIHLMTFSELIGVPPEWWLKKYGNKWYADWIKGGGKAEAELKYKTNIKLVKEWMVNHRSEFMVFILNTDQRTQQWDNFLKEMSISPSSIIQELGPFKNITHYTQVERLYFFVIQIPKYYS